jgi:hypothetical protein
VRCITAAGGAPIVARHAQNALRTGYLHALCSHFASQATPYSSSAQQQRPEILPRPSRTHRLPRLSLTLTCVCPRRPPLPLVCFPSLTATLPTLLSAAAFCHTGDLRYGCAFQGGPAPAVYIISYSLGLAVTCTLLRRSSEHGKICHFPPILSKD